MKELTLDEKLSVLREFLQEEGASLDLTIWKKDSKVEAQDLLAYYACDFKSGIEMNDKGWGTIRNDNIRITVFYEQSKAEKKAELLKELQYLEEDVLLDGMPEGDQIA